jgi:leucyl aminopeptidase
MHNCLVTARKGPSQLTAIIAGHCPAVLPKTVARETRRLSADKKREASRVLTDTGTYLIAKLPDKEWLVGGEKWRITGQRIAAAVRESGCTAAHVPIDAPPEDVQSLVEGIVLGDYVFDEFRSSSEDSSKRITVRIPGQSAAIRRGLAIAEPQNRAREFLDLPANELNPATFVSRARRVCRGSGLRTKVTQGLKALQEARFPGLVQVGKAGSAEPALLELHYRPPKRSKTRLALVGKGVTFDSGGLSLKTPAGMPSMKADMGGAAAVLGAMLTIARLKPRVAVSAYMALAENMPGSGAYRPGDIYRARNGKSIHVQSTDAEGRLVLSDTLTYACEQGATHIVEASTLTGACMVALGNSIAGLMTNDDGWAGEVRAAGLRAGEEFWQLPLYGEYREQLKHPHADLNNTGGRWAGTITAGIFLSEFVADGVKWAHCDIAGKAYRSDKAWRYYTRGATAFGARTFAELALTL